MKTIVSYKERGNYGSNKYRGNCTGKLPKDLFDFFKPSFVADFMCGSDTVGEVCKDLKIKHRTLDLNKGFDLVEDDITFRYDFNFFHPPYHDIIKYSGYQYGNKAIKNDLSHIKDYKEFVKVLNYVIAKQYGSLKTGGHMAILIGDIKRKGKLYSPFLDMIKPGSLYQIMIKEQHNCWSDNLSYKGRFIPIVHEYLIVLRKDNPYMYEIKITKDISLDVRDSKKITWKDVVSAILEKLGGKANLKDIYREFNGHKKANNNSNWKAKIRQTLQIYKNIFKNIDRGIWALC